MYTVKIEMSIDQLALLVNALQNEQARVAQTPILKEYAYRLNGLANQVSSLYDAELHKITCEMAAKS